MPQRKLQKKPRRSAEEYSVFLNIPYDDKFKSLYLAYIAGLTAVNALPRATLEIPTSKRRLERIIDLLNICSHSIHDLSRVQLERTQPPTPRFNMPFELGLAVALGLGKRKDNWFVCETLRRRVDKSLSDLAGTDVHIHDGRIEGVFSVLCDIFVWGTSRPSASNMEAIYAVLRSSLPQVMRDAGAISPFTARVFTDLRIVAKTEHLRLVKGGRS